MRKRILWLLLVMVTWLVLSYLAEIKTLAVTFASGELF
jgi:hypothetical protein